MTTIYTTTLPNTKISFAQLDSNFSNISSNKLEQTSSTGACLLPVGDNTNQPVATAGALRFNTSTLNFECKYNTIWNNIGARGQTGGLATVTQGTVGYTGSGTNIAGVQGITGFKGSVGETGYRGSRGERGPRGSTGNNGATGYTGSKGPNGDTGPKGYTGSQGDPPNTIIHTTKNNEGFSIGTIVNKPGFSNTDTGAHFADTGNIYISKSSSTSVPVLELKAFSGNDVYNSVRFLYNSTLIAGINMSTDYFIMGPESGYTLTINTTSDYRLKENLIIPTNEIEKLDKLNLYNFNFICKPNKKEFGFVAHEIQEYVSEMVTYNKDDINEDGSPNYQLISYYNMVSFLFSCLLELNKEIEDISQLLSEKNNG